MSCISYIDTTQHLCYATTNNAIYHQDEAPICSYLLLIRNSFTLKIYTKCRGLRLIQLLLPLQRSKTIRTILDTIPPGGYGNLTKTNACVRVLFLIPAYLNKPFEKMFLIPANRLQKRHLQVATEWQINLPITLRPPNVGRSEERRVGKECLL